MFQKNAINAYMTVAEDIHCYDPAQIIRMLLDSAIDAIEKTKEALLIENAASATHHLTRAMNIVAEGLAPPLDMEFPVSKTILLSYEIAIQNLLMANLSRKPEPLDRALIPLAAMRDAWKTIEASGGQSA